MFEEKIKELIAKATKLGKKEIKIVEPFGAAKQFGDLSFACFDLAKREKTNPQKIAEELAAKLKKKLPEEISDVKAVGGYINFFLNKSIFLQETMEKIMKEKDKYGSSNIGRGKTIVIDYSSPNIAKPFTIGHLRSTIIGQALCNIFRFFGYKVIGDNHLGDWGTQFGKLMFAYKKWGKKELLQKEPIKELLKLYVKFHKEAEKNPVLEDEARAWFKKLENGDKEAVKLWKWFKDLSLEEFDRLYKLLDIKFDEVLGESFYNDKLKPMVKEALDKSVAEWAEAKHDSDEETVEEDVEKKEKVVLVWLKKYGIEAPLLLQKSDGASLYATRDLATAKYRLEKWKPEKILYVVGSEQKLYFQQWFKVFELLGYKADLIHVYFGLIRLPGGKMATRKGRVIFLEDVLKEAVQRAKKIIMERNLSAKEKENIAIAVGIGAVKYADLSQNRIKDIDFDWDKILSLKGNSAPYIQYTYVRACNILKKLKKEKQKLKIGNPNYKNLDEKEYVLAKELSSLPSVISDTLEQFKPHLLCNYIYGLSQTFNDFYESCSVIRAEPEVKARRVELVRAVKQTLANALNLLGIPLLEAM